MVRWTILLSISIVVAAGQMSQKPPQISGGIPVQVPGAEPIAPPERPVGIDDVKHAEQSRKELLERDRKQFAGRAQEFSQAWRAWAEVHNKVVASDTLDVRLQDEEARLWRNAMNKMKQLRRHKLAKELEKPRLRSGL